MNTLRHTPLFTSLLSLSLLSCAQFEPAAKARSTHESVVFQQTETAKPVDSEAKDIPAVEEKVRSTNKAPQDLTVRRETKPVQPSPEAASPSATAGQVGSTISGGGGGSYGVGGLGIRGTGHGGGGRRTGHSPRLAASMRIPKKRTLGKRKRASTTQYKFEADAISGDFEKRNDARFNRPTDTVEDRLSTFAVDVDTAAYSIARRSLRAGTLPAPSLVRVEEFLNYFHYDYDAPSENAFAIQFDGSQSPVDQSKHLLRIGIQAKEVSVQDRLPTNIVFLVDTSCSMTSSDKLELAKSSMRIAVENLTEKDQVAITTYAGHISLVLPPTNATRTDKIFAAIQSLRPSGGTAMQSGMEVAYQQAALMLKPKNNTRVIVLSDGDANIGATRHEDILKSVKGFVSEGVRLTTIGYGDGNYKDQTMEQLANKGNGNYYYIDSPRMAARVFGRDLTQMLQDVAQDVKIQVEFNTKAVKSYRLIGYENRKVADQDFRKDEVDAGEIGAGHQVTALYELRLHEGVLSSHNLATVRVRAKKPRASKAKESARRVQVARVTLPFSASAEDFRFATAVMGASELMRHSPHAKGWSYKRVLSIIDDAMSADPDRQEFLQLIQAAEKLSHGRRNRYSIRD